MSELYVVYGCEDMLSAVFLKGTLYIFNGADWNDSCDDSKTFVRFWTNGSWGGFRMEGKVTSDDRYELKYEAEMGGGMMGQYGHTETSSTVIDPNPERALETCLEYCGRSTWETKKKTAPTLNCSPKSITDCMKLLDEYFK